MSNTLHLRKIFYASLSRAEQNQLLPMPFVIGKEDLNP